MSTIELDGLRIQAMSGNRSGSFLIGFLAAFLLGSMAVVAFNVVVDPFRIFEIVDIEGVNAQRTLASTRSRLAKANRVCFIDATSAVMGTSRVEVGVNPGHPGWRRPERVYNLALPGMGIGEIEKTFRHLVNASPHLEEVAIGIDFLMFNANREAVVFNTEVSDFDPQRLLLESSQSCWKTYIRSAADVVGPAALRYSLRTISRQIPPPDKAELAPSAIQTWIAQYSRDGYRGRYFDVLLPRAEKNGFRIFFGGAGQERYYVGKVWRPAPEERYCLTAPGQPDTLKVFGDLLNFAQKSGVRVHIFINPIHARMLIGLREGGLWPLYEEWKRGLVRVNEEVARQNDAAPLPIWDFSGFNTVTTERIPEPGDRKTPMLYWWEASHYREAAGTLALDRMLGYHDPGGRIVPDDYGALLTGDSIEAWLERTRSAALAYMRDQPREYEIVKTAVDRVMEGAPGANCGYDVAAVKVGSQLLKAGDEAGAEAEFARAVELREEDMARYAALGVPYREAALDTMIAQARAGVTFQPALAGWREYSRRANRRVAEGDQVGALADIDAAIRLARPTAVLYQSRGSIRMKVGDLDGARRDLDAALKLEPRNEEVLAFMKTLDGLMAAVGRPANAEAAAAGTEVAAAPALQTWRQYNQRGTRRAAERDFTGALADFDAAIGLAPPMAVLYQTRGSVRMKAGDLDGAREDFEKGLQLQPGNKHILALVKTLDGRTTARARSATAAPQAGEVGSN